MNCSVCLSEQCAAEKISNFLHLSKQRAVTGIFKVAHVRCAT